MTIVAGLPESERDELLSALRPVTREDLKRLMPDLMADYYIEKSCIAPSGK